MLKENDPIPPPANSNIVYPPRFQARGLKPVSADLSHTAANLHATATRSLPHRLLQWLLRITKTELEVSELDPPEQMVWNVVQNRFDIMAGDWQSVELLCGYGRAMFEKIHCPLPLTAAEISFFQRDHGPRRSVHSYWTNHQLSELPPALASLYEIYLSQARHDVEAALTLAQASGSTRVARVMADMLAVGSFALADRAAQDLANVYAISAAFDTALLIDQANHEAACRLLLPIEHDDHLLKLAPDDIAALADQLLQRSLLPLDEFLEKAALLAEARADVNRYDAEKQFAEAMAQGDLPMDELWVQRICAGYARLLFPLVANLPELAVLADAADVMA